MLKDEFTKTIKEENTEIEVFTYPNENELSFFIEKGNSEESYFYLSIEKAKDFINIINEAIKHIEERNK